MTELSNIQFYEVCKIPKPQKKLIETGRRWEVTKSTLFEDKVKLIKMRAERINQKLVNY